MGLKVKTGHKVFDLRRNMVVKFFSPDLDPEALRAEIDAVRRIGAHDFAPRIQRWDVERGWYEEEYIKGNPLDEGT